MVLQAVPGDENGAFYALFVSSLDSAERRAAFCIFCGVFCILRPAALHRKPESTVRTSFS